LRISILANQTQRPMSQILQIKNSYVSYCVDETSHYVYHKWKQKVKEQEELKALMGRHSKKKK
jgi:hypothetical protein